MALIAGGVMIAVGLLAWYAGRAELSRIRALRHVRCGDARAGGHMVRVVGRAHSNRPLVAPFSGKECVLYRVVVEYMEDTRTRNDSDVRRQTTTLRYADDAAIEDETGELQLALDGARLSLSTIAYGKDDAARKMADELLPSVRNCYVTSIREERLDMGDPVLAIGIVDRARSGLVLSGDQKLELWGGGENRLKQVNGGADLLSWALVIAGVAVVAAGGFGLFDGP